jgi:hypothetical protein
MDKLRDIILENNKKLINYTYKIKTDQELEELILKIAVNSKYNNFVFLLEVPKLNKEVIKILVNSGMINNIITNGLIILFHSDNYFYLDLNTNYNKLNISNFLNNASFNCCICLTNNVKTIDCTHCSAIYCHKCIKKISNCAVCRQSTYNIIKVNIKDIVEI